MSLIHTCINIYDTALAAISRGMLRGLRLLICLYDKAASPTSMYVCALLPYMPVFYYYAVVVFFYSIHNTNTKRNGMAHQAAWR